MVFLVNAPAVITTAFVTLLILLLPPDLSHALSYTNFGSTPNVNSPQCRHCALSSGRCTEVTCAVRFARQRHFPPLRAVAENTMATETCSKEDDDTGDISRSPIAPPRLTVAPGPGARIISVSSGMVVEPDFWETKFDQGEFVRILPPPEKTKVDVVNNYYNGKEEKVVVEYESAVEQDFWETKFDEGEFVRNLPSPQKTKVAGVNKNYPRKGDKAIVDYDPFLDQVLRVGDIHLDNNFIVTEIKNERENDIIEDTDSNFDNLDETENIEDSRNETTLSDSDELSFGSVLCSAKTEHALLHHAGIAGAANILSRSNGGSSWAKTYVVNKSRRDSVRNQGGGTLGRVMDTVRMAAAAATAMEQKKLLEKSGPETKPGESSAREVNNLITNESLTANPSSSNWKSGIQSTVANVLKSQDAVIQQQSLGTVTPHSESSMNTAPLGTTSMGLLGEAVQEKLPAVPPLPGTLLVRPNGDIITTTEHRPSIRSSIPHSSDDIHIANLRLSVFSRFDEEQQRTFRSRSVEILNIRRRRGSVVLVAELAVSNKAEGEHHHGYLTEMQARTAKGHGYGEKLNGGPAAIACSKPSPPSFTVTSVRGAKITSVSPGGLVDHNLGIATGEKLNGRPAAIACSKPSPPSFTVTSVRGAKITSVSPGGLVDHNLGIATIGINHEGYTSQTKNRGSIMGSIECSHQEFRGTMLGNSCRKGSLMYVTEVAVCSDARRCGVGTMLMRGVDVVASLRNVETIYLHVDVANRAACAMYEKCGYRYLDKLEPIHAQFTASLNLHDGAMRGRKHYLMCKNIGV